MDHVSILRLVSELRRCHGELEGVEAKAAHTGTPADLFKPLSAFANRPSGGVLLFGLDEDAGKLRGIHFKINQRLQLLLGPIHTMAFYRI